MNIETQWILTVDERKSQLYSCHFEAGNRWHVEQVRSLANPWENYHEHHRPNALGRGPTANAAQHYAASEHEPEEEHRRFAKEVANWLARATQELNIVHIDIFAASRFLGLLHRELGYLEKIARTHQAELTRVSASDLATHPVVLSVLNAGAHMQSVHR
jgi:protein required for attachment to host cells